LCDALEADPDGDGYSTQEELACSSDPMNATSIPVDIDGDGACDALANPEVTFTNVTDEGEGVVVIGQSVRFDAVTEDMDVEAWTIAPALPAGLTFNTTDGSISGTLLATSLEGRSTHTVTAQEAGFGRLFAVDVTLIIAPDTDNDGIADDDPDGLGPFRGDMDDDNDGWNDTIEAACGSDPLDATSYPGSTFALVGGACVDLSSKPIDPPTEEGPRLFTMFLLFWIGVALLALLHRTNERREHRKKLAAEKDDMISKMIQNEEE